MQSNRMQSNLFSRSMVNCRSSYALMVIAAVVVVFVGLSGCKSNSDDEESPSLEVSQQLGDVMASVDEFSGVISSGDIADLGGWQKSFARLEAMNDKSQKSVRSEILGHSGVASVAALLKPSSAIAASCNSSTGGWGSCSSGTITRVFPVGCTLLSGTVQFSGSIGLAWKDGSGNAKSSCQLSTVNDVVTRNPSFSMEGRLGATLAVSRSGSYGQRLKLTSGSGNSRVFQFESDGIRRVFTDSSGSSTLDFTTSATAVTVTNATRNGRVMNGGAIVVVNNKSQVTCAYTPTNVTWGSSSCNCPTQGSWQASCSDGASSTLQITGCGTANFTIGNNSGTINFDRCGT